MNKRSEIIKLRMLDFYVSLLKILYKTTHISQAAFAFWIAHLTRARTLFHFFPDRQLNPRMAIFGYILFDRSPGVLEAITQVLFIIRIFQMKRSD